MDFRAQLLIIYRVMHFSEILFGIHQVVWSDFTPLCLPGLLQNIQKFDVGFGLQMSQRSKFLGEHFKIIIRNDTVLIHVEDVVQGAHFSTPKFGVALFGIKINRWSR